MGRLTMNKTPSFDGAYGYRSSSDFFSAASARMKLITFQAIRKANPKVNTKIIIIVNLLTINLLYVVFFVNNKNKKRRIK